MWRKILVDWKTHQMTNNWICKFRIDWFESNESISMPTIHLNRYRKFVNVYQVKPHYSKFINVTKKTKTKTRFGFFFFTSVYPTDKWSGLCVVCLNCGHTRYAHTSITSTIHVVLWETLKYWEMSWSPIREKSSVNMKNILKSHSMGRCVCVCVHVKKQNRNEERKKLTYTCLLRVCSQANERDHTRVLYKLALPIEKKRER